MSGEAAETRAVKWLCAVLFALVLIIWLLPLLAIWLDEATVQRQPLDQLLTLDQRVFEESLMTRLIGSESEFMPAKCINIIPHDAVASAQLAEDCTTWCHEALGSNSATPYMLSPLHVIRIMRSSLSDTFLMCYKAQTASWALRWMPEWYSVYLYAMLYGSISIVFFWCRWLATSPVRNSDLGPSNQYVIIQNDSGQLPLLCPDRIGSKRHLWLEAFFVWLEPFGDVVSILSLFRIGQPFPGMFMSIGCAIPCVWAVDLFQIRGALAIADSLRQGFANKQWVTHKAIELSEIFICTSVQVYILLAMHVEIMHLSTVLPLPALFTRCLRQPGLSVRAEGTRTKDHPKQRVTTDC
ncbi:Zinc finger HIT domain-containing protein 2 [Durusdinium trenchii]|uniref:Zinc finger HIT domain-containing protein 2 n=1 Tax=Durusdinium trenchii TaxID=1381693 RepID=A0ABP0KMU4_9DINO